MKQTITLLLLALYIGTQAQTTTSGMKWKSAMEINYIYSGEIKNDKPDGKGVAISVDGSVKVFGDFRNGMINGTAVVFYSGGKITLGEWADGWAYGRGLSLGSDKTLYYGDYKRGYLEGKIIQIKANGEINIGDYKQGNFNGRMISAWAGGKNLSDNMVTDGLRNGPGYQFDAESQTKYEGIWENNQWLKESTGNYPSFMRNEKFYGETNDQKTSIYTSTNAERKLEDTCFIYFKEQGIRGFGYFESGNLARGIMTDNDNTYIIGEYDNKGKKQGLCVEYQKNEYLRMAWYKDDLPEGEGISIEFNNADTVVYYGQFKTGFFTGKGAKLNAQNAVLVGDFQLGELADGRKIFRKETVTGPKQITVAGQKVDLYPKDACTALNFLLKEFDNGFKNITSKKEFVSENKEANPFLDEYSAYESLYNFPGALVNKITKVYKQNNFYFGLAVSDDYSVIKKKYDNLCTQLKACNLVALQKGKIMKLSGTAKTLSPGEEVITIFHLPLYGDKRRTPKIVISLDKYKSYQLTAQITSYQEIE